MKVLCRDLGTMDYASCWELQRSLFEELAAEKRGRTRELSEGAERGAERGAGEEAGRGAGEETGRGARREAAGTILLVEHPPVYTLGKSGHAENLLVDRTALERLGAQFFHIDRGGDITFHGPGQLVCYPILDLERIGIGLREYIERLEEAVIRAVAGYGIAAGRIPGASGVWIEGSGTSAGEAPANRDTAASGSAGVPQKKEPPRKICAIGVRSSRYVTMHGFALNVTTDLGWFARINPCGFRDRGVTSIARETGRDVAMDEAKRLVLRELERQLDIEIESKC